MATISNNTIVSLIDTQTNSGTVLLPKTSDIPYRAILFKDLYGTFDTKPLTLNTQSPDVFEDGTSVKRFNDKFTYLTLYADTSHSKWVILNGTQNNSITVSTLNGVQTGYISSLNVNALTFASGNGWLDLTALRAVLVSTIQLDSAIGNFSSISGNGSQIVALNAISSLSLQSTVVGLGTFGYLSTNTVPSTIVGLGTFGYLSSSQLLSTTRGLGNIYLSTNTVPSTIIGLGTFGYLSTNTVPSTIVGLGTFGYISSTQLYSTVTGLIDSPEVQSTIIGLGTFGYLSTNTVPSTIIGLGAFGYISSTQLTSTVAGLGTFGYVSSLTSISTNNLSTGNLFAGVISSLQFNASSMNANRAGINILTGTNNQFNTFTENLFPNRQTATLGYTTGGESGGGWYSNINGRQFNSISTNTNIIGSATGAGDIGSTVRVLGTLSTQNQVASSITTNILFARSNVSTNVITTQFLRGAGQFGNLVYTTSLLPDGGNASFGNSALTNVFNQIWGSNINTETIIPRFGNHPQSTVRILGTLSTGILNVSTILAINVNVSTIFVSTAVVTLDINVSSITGNGSNLFNLNAISSLSLQSTVVGLGAFGYLSTNTVPSTILGLGTFGYLSTNTVPSTIVGLGTFGYLSTNTVPSTIVGLGTFGYLSTNTVPSTIVGLGTFGYISTTQLESTIVGWAGIPATQDVNIDGKFITNVNQLLVDNINTYTQTSVGFVTDINLSFNSIHDVNTITTEYISSSSGVVILSNSDFIPSADDSYDLGSVTNRWRELYVAGTSIHLGNSLVLSEDLDGKLSTNAMIVSSINVENLSTGTIKTQLLYLETPGGIGFITDSVLVSGIGYSYPNMLIDNSLGDITLDAPNINVDGNLDLLNNSIKNVNTITTEYISSSSGVVTLSNSDFIPSVDDAYNLGSVTNRWRELYIAGTSIHLGNSLVLSEDSSGRLSTNKIIFTPGLDLDNEAITNVLQTQTVTSGATNATIPQTLFYPIGTVEIIDDYIQIQPDPPLSPQYFFKNLGNFQYFKVSCSLSGSGVGVPISLYFELAKKVGEVTVKFGGDLVTDGNPYYSIPNPMIGGGIHNISYVDRYNLTGLATNDIFFPLLWVRTDSSVAQFDAGVGNIFLTIEPIISYTS